MAWLHIIVPSEIGLIRKGLMNERRVLESWKAIAAYLGRTEKTCRKWEHELGLPVHRLDKSAKAHVFAYADELNRWKAEKVQAEKTRKAGGFFGLLGLSRFSRRARFWIITIAGLVVLAIIGLMVRQITQNRPSPGGPQAVKGVAILPFADLSPGKEYEYLCDGIAETLIDALNKIEGLRVPARTSAFYFKGKNTPLQEIGKKLNVDYVLEASVQADGERLRIIPRLLKVADGYQIWSEKYDRGREDIFAVEDDIAQGIAKALEIKVLGAPGAPIVKPGTRNLEAYNLYLNGQFYLKRERFSWRQSIEFFERAVEKDPDYAEAYAGIAAAYDGLTGVGLLRPAEAYPKAKAASLKALEIDSRNAWALGVLSSIRMAYDWDFVGAENDIRKATQDNPGNPYLHGYYAKLLSALGRYEEALAQIEPLARLDPLSPNFIGCSEESIYYFSRKYDLALEGWKKRLELDPQNGGMYINLVLVYLAMERYEDARAVNQRRREVLGTSSQPDDLEPWNAMVYALTGNQARAREIAANLEAYRKDDYFPCHVIAWIHAALGEKDEAFYWLEKAYQERSGQLYLLNVYPLSDPLRDDPRFKDLLRRIGLEK
jgi:TolB-like protein